MANHTVFDLRLLRTIHLPGRKQTERNIWKGLNSVDRDKKSHLAPAEKSLQMIFSGLSGTAQDADALVLVKLFQGVTGGSEIFAGVEEMGTIGKDLANGSGDGKTTIRIDIDFTHRKAGGFAQLVLADADGILKIATVLIDLGDDVLGNRG